MMPARVTIVSALFTLLQGVMNFKLKSQRYIPWDQLSPATQFPGLMLWEDGDRYEWRADLLARITLRTKAIIFMSASADLTVAPVQDIDNLLDAIDAALAPSTGMDKVTGRQTLGNLVYNCRIEGEVVKASGDLDGISLLVVPINITVGNPAV